MPVTVLGAPPILRRIFVGAKGVFTAIEWFIRPDEIAELAFYLWKLSQRATFLGKQLQNFREGFERAAQDTVDLRDGDPVVGDRYTRSRR